MSLFGGLFDKKTCAICGGDIGLLGNKKLEDGNMCKKCAAKLSPYFDDRRHSTVDAISEQLAYRAANQDAVNNFHPTRVLGRDMKVFLDENTGRFLLSRNNDFKNENPDIIDIRQMTRCDYRIDESHYEEKRTVKDAEGKSHEESYNPPHYNYSYHFRMTIGVDHPYFNEIRFDVNTFSIEVKSTGLIGTAATAHTGSGSGKGGFLGMAMDILDALADSADPRMSNPEYTDYLRISDEIRDTLNQTRDRFMGISAPVQSAPVQQAPADAQPASTNRPKFCPNCGSPVTSATAAFCEFCGSRL